MTSPMTKLDYANPTLRREIGLFGAVMLGLGSILGTGVFVSLAHATELAGPWVLLAIVLAGLLAYCNAMSSAQLAAAYPVSGGTYEYGYRVLSPSLGFTAGWMFLLAKSASAATAALGVTAYLIDAGYADSIWNRMGIAGVQSFAVPASILAVIIMTLGVVLGLRRSSAINSVLVTTTLVGLGVFTVAVIGKGEGNWMGGWSYVPTWATTLHAAAIVFVAFAGYARVATLSEEVHSPTRTIPRAIVLSLLISAIVYALIGFILSRASRSYELGVKEPSALMTIASVNGYGRLYLVVLVAAVTAMLGVLLNLILGLSRVWLAMGRRGDMPRILARVNEKTSTPVPATILSGMVIALLVLVGDVRTTWSFSAFTVLIYYAITNLACLRLAPEHRRYPRLLAWVGLFACLGLAWFVEMKVWIVGTILIAVGLLWHHFRKGERQRSEPVA